MPSPFPGMDPYLEDPALWPDMHHGMISGIQAALNPHIRPKYVAAVEMRVYISDDDDSGRRVMVPDVRIDRTRKKQLAGHGNHSSPATTIEAPLRIKLLNDEIEDAYIEIREPLGGRLVTIIEVLSPTNKVPGSSGRASFIAKRRDVMKSPVHWVEIDLLRSGKPASLNKELAKSDYRIIVSRGSDHADAGCWSLSVREPLPTVGIPLKSNDPDVPLDLGAVLQTAYDRGAWDLHLDYSKPPSVPLASGDSRWANKLLRGKRMR
jgi:hypothetical protein